jgi:endonuclease/exonuclease/phosphatase family metal-dependent hydrolase
VKRLRNSLRLLTLFLLLPGMGLQGCATVNLNATPDVRYYPGSAEPAPAANTAHDGRLRIMTFNIAHGRGESFHQLLQNSSTTLANLDSIADLLRNSGAQVVALQEADAPSFWSGNFNHIDHLADNAAYSQSVHGLHVDGMGLAYGTALIARLDLGNPRAVTFDPGLSPVPKGFVVSTISWPGHADVDVDVVSVHLDNASATTRRKQTDELIATLRQRQHPVILMGDFNSGWQGNSCVRHISQALGLTAYRPDVAGLETFPAFGERLDWILVSAGIVFRSYALLPDSLSDHRGVLAELELEGKRTTRLARTDESAGHL